MKLKALSASEALERFLALAEKLWPNQQLMLEVSTEVAQLGLRVEAQGNQLRQHDLLKRFAEVVAKRAHIMANRAMLRPQHQQNRGFVYTCSDWIVGDLQLENSTSFEESAAWAEALDGVFAVTPYVDLVGAQAANAHEKVALQIRERALADLQTQTARLGELLAKVAQDDAQQRRTLNAELEKEWRTKAEQDATEHRRKLDEVEERRKQYAEELAGREKAFAEEKAQFETRGAQLVRRQMLKKLEEVLAKSESMSLSISTQQKRNPVHVTVWGLFAAAGTLAFFMGTRFLTSDPPNWHYGVPMATGTLTLFASIVYYVKWNDRWFREHSEGELAAKRYQADIVRANWLAELVAEQRQLNSELPPELLEAFTRNLFRGSSTLAEAEHPFEQITSMLKRAKELKIGGGQLSLRAAKRKEKPATDTSE